MKRLFITFLIFFIQLQLKGQNTLYSGAAGGSGGSTTTNSVQWSIGEPVIFTSTPIGTLTQGFNQPASKIGLLTQTIVGFSISSSAVMGQGPIILPGTATSGLTITYTSSDPTIVNISGNIAQILSTGAVTITATQVGNAVYKPATPVLRPLIINKMPQVITGFNSLPPMTIGGIYTLSGVTGGASGNPVVFASSDTSIISVKNNVFYYLIEGTATITATQAGNANYAAATPISLIATVTGAKIKRTQIITGLPNLIVLGIGEQKEITGLASSGLVVAYSINNELVTITGNMVVGLLKGSSLITASQAGNDNYLAAPDITVQVVVTVAGTPTIEVGIIGKETVVPLLFTEYKQVLEGTGYTYSWKYVGGPLTFIGDSTTSKVQVRFPETSKSGQLWSFIYDSTGKLIDYSIQNITVSSGVSANVISQLTESTCDQQASFCGDSYIKSFTLGKISNLNSGCSPAGFGDFTALRIDTLFMGFSYSANVVSFSSNAVSYFGIWIDYNNNGSFDDPGEFFGSSFGSDTTVAIPNLLVLNDPTYIGARRLRVKMRSTQLGATESCTSGKGEGGETEEYSIFIQQVDRLQAPNLITPNNDGKNDLFIIRGINSKKSSHLVIVDRWGETKFESNAYENDWDGKDMHGNTLKRGTYFYFYTNGPDTIKGFVEVINQ